MSCVPVLDHLCLDGKTWTPPAVEHELPPLAVVGTAPWWVYEAENIPAGAHVMAVNDAGHEMTWRPVRWWATLHPEKLREWAPLRLENGGDFVTVVSPFHISERYLPPENRRRIEVGPLAGSSGLYAVLAGLALGYRDIRLYGISLDRHCEEFREQWEAIAPLLKETVTVPCPGFLREVFGTA